MDYILYYSFFFALVLLVFGFLYQKKFDQRFYFIVGVVLALVVVLSVFLFGLVNVNSQRANALLKYNLFWLNMIFYIALGVTVLTLAVALIKRKFYPHGLLSIFSIIQIIFYVVLRGYYAI